MTPPPPGAILGPLRCQGCGTRKWWRPTGSVGLRRTGHFVDVLGRRHSCTPANVLRTVGRAYWADHEKSADYRRAYKRDWMRRKRASEETT